MSSLIKDISVNARYDLQAPSVQIYYETQNTINGQPSLSLSTDFYPNPLPTGPGLQFAALQFTVNLQGLSAHVTTAKLAVDAILPNDPDWWLARHPQHKPHDPTNPADAGGEVASFTIDATTLQRTPNPAVDSHGNAGADKGYPNELTSGQIAPWMNFNSQRITLKVNATVIYRNGNVQTNVPLTYQCISTDATSGTFSDTSVQQFAEPIPDGLAQNIFDAISVLQFEGRLTLQEQDVSGSLLIGQLFNLTGGALAEWSTMNALVQSVTENLDDATTEIEFGPAKYLTAGELVDLLRVNRLRLNLTTYAARINGAASGLNTVDLGDNTPEKNSVSAPSPPNPQVVSQTVDGSGPVITHFSDTSDCTSTWAAASASQPGAPPPVPGSVTIQLSATNGEDLFIQKLPLCMNGVPGTMYFLCSSFVPDPS